MSDNHWRLTLPGSYDENGAIWKAAESTPDPQAKWRSPLHQPRWASRATLVLTEPTVPCRARDISEADAQAEWAELMREGWAVSLVPSPSRTYRNGFYAVWNEIHGQPAATDPRWLWRYAFRLQEGE